MRQRMFNLMFIFGLVCMLSAGLIALIIRPSPGEMWHDIGFTAMIVGVMAVIIAAILEKNYLPPIIGGK